MMRRIVEFSVNNSLFVNLLSLFLVIAGVISLLAMQREAFPNISYDVVSVRTDYPGAPPEEVEKLVTIELEDELKEVSGIDEMTSISTENISIIVLQIDPAEKDKTKIVTDIQRAVDRVDDLPEDAEDSEVEALQTKDIPVINVSLSGDFDELELQRLARLLELRFLDLRDVARIERLGWRDREIWVEVTPKIVDDYKLSLEDVVLALRNQNLNVPGGTLHAKEGDYLVRTIGEFKTADDIRKVIIRANDLGNWIRVSDVAEVRDTFEDDDVIEKTFGKPAITLTVVKKENGDIIRLVKQIKETAELFKKDHEKLQVSYFDDYSFYVKRRLNVLKNNGAIGIILVVFSLLVFLSRRTAVMTALGIPVAVMTAFFGMYAFGLTINLITMFALIMVLGMVVDDAIIIAENVYRHREMGLSAREATIQGTSQVAKPVITTVLTTIAAFIPILFMSGIIGKYIAVIPVIVIITLSASLFECFVILPSHLTDFGGSMRGKGKSESPWFIKMRERYLAMLKWVISHRYKAVMAFVCVFVGSLLLFFAGMRFILFPQGMIEEFFIRAKAPIGTSLEEMDKRLANFGDLIKKMPDTELENFVTQVGMMREGPDDPYTDRGSHLGQVHVFLTPESRARGRRKADDIIAELREKSKAFEDIFDEVTFEKVRAGPPVGKPVAIRLRGDDLDLLDEAASVFKRFLSGIPGLKDVRDDYDIGKTELRVIVDEEKATKAYLTVRDVANAVRRGIEGGEATKIRKTDEEIEVIVKYPDNETTSKEVFDRALVPNRLGNLVPLMKIATLEEAVGVNAIKHFDRKRMVNVTADLDEKQITPIEVEGKVRAYYKTEIQKRYPSITMSFGGEQEETKESLHDFIRALFLSLFFIFIILAANFNSIVRPLIVMSAIPFGIVGVIVTFFLHGQPLSFMALLGTIGLSGVVVNDSIVLVDFIHAQRKEQGLGRMESIIEAGKLRLRPVILTSVTTVFGLMPVAYGIGGSDPFIKPMALAISYGIAFATVLTLLLVPCLYSIADDVTDQLGRLRVRLGWVKVSEGGSSQQ
ncbi:MAG: efflux RND transporter permease subunit [Candidatus Omnitrophota bacterium]|nr:efflux RND transporter permease subunit [Candidatus Omnitrophota bacterium]